MKLSKIIEKEHQARRELKEWQDSLPSEIHSIFQIDMDLGFDGEQPTISFGVEYDYVPVEEAIEALETLIQKLKQ